MILTIWQKEISEDFQALNFRKDSRLRKLKRKTIACPNRLIIQFVERSHQRQLHN